MAHGQSGESTESVWRRFPNRRREICGLSSLLQNRADHQLVTLRVPAAVQILAPFPYIAKQVVQSPWVPSQRACPHVKALLTQIRS